jgi:hypothetical protein
MTKFLYIITPFLISPKGEKVAKKPAWKLRQVEGDSFPPGGRLGRGLEELTIWTQ